jgi:hypothetical protein
MVKMMQDAGVEPVAIYPLSSSISDLSPLTTLEAAGFKPRATLIILNEGRADPTAPREQCFRRIMQHSAYRAAIDRGAIQLWMPRLFVAKEIEERRITFKEARDGIVRLCCTEAGPESARAQFPQPSPLFKRYGHTSRVRAPAFGSGP